MKKLNKKGFTVIELTLSFLFVFTIAFAMFELVFNYRTKQNQEAIKAQLKDYTNQITLAIQNDIVERTLNRIDYCTIDDEIIDRCLVLYFNDGTNKQLAVESDYKIYEGEQYKINYIVYGGIIYESADSLLLDYRPGYMLYNTYESDKIENRNVNIYKISIPIYHNELEGNHGLSIVTVAYNYDENWTPSDDDLGGGNQGNGNVCDLESEPEKLEGEAYALVLDNSANPNDNLPMIFVRSKTPIKAGDTYNSKTYGNIKVKDAYTGFETETYYGTSVSLVQSNYFEDSGLWTPVDVLDTPWSTYSARITSVIVEDKVRFASMDNLFYDYVSLSYIDVGNIDISKHNSLIGVFEQVASGYNPGGPTPNIYISKGPVTIIGLEKWDTSCITDMSYLFNGINCEYCNFNLSNWDVSNVTDMSFMFSDVGLDAKMLDLGDLSKWDVSNVTNMSFMFSNAGDSSTTFNIGDLSKWDVSKVTNMQNMFGRAGYQASYSLDLSKWNVNKVTSYDYFNDGVENNITPPKWKH